MLTTLVISSRKPPYLYGGSSLMDFTLPIKIGDKFIGKIYDKKFEYECMGIKITRKGIYLLTTYDMEFKYPEEVELVERNDFNE